MLLRASLLALEVVLFLPVKMVAANSAGERGKGGGGGGGVERGDCEVCTKKSIQVVKILKRW